MDRGGCQMSGGGGGGGGGGDGGGPDRHGMITLEDLESFSEDQLSDSGNGSLEEEGETMEEDEDSDRLLHYWQEVARGHQVEVSQGKKKRINKTKQKHVEEKQQDPRPAATSLS